MKFKTLTILFSIFYFLFSSNSVLSIGIGANPSFLDLELKLGQSKEVKISVFNISKEVGIFQVFPDELNDWIKITPDNFRLEAGENKEVKIEISAKEKGKKATNLSLSAVPLDRSSFSVNPGLKIPLRLNVEGQKEFFLASLFKALDLNAFSAVIIISITCLMGFFLVEYVRRRGQILFFTLRCGSGKKRKSPKIISPPENLPIEKL